MKPLTLLTVGDGDMSASLAILRAYKPLGAIRHLVATTIMPSREALVETYPSSAPSILEELASDAYADSVTVLYNVDATQLHTHAELKHQSFDVILFHHPHLGYDPQTSSEEHAARHAALLAHYFHSASFLLANDTKTSCIHVCLCRGTVSTWQLDETIQHLQMEYVFDSPQAASRPLLETILVPESHNVTAATSKQQQQQQVVKKIAKGGGSRKGHWLGKYGYRHKPTFPQVTKFQTNVSSSYHYFARPTKSMSQGELDNMRKGDLWVELNGRDTSTTSSISSSHHRCPICRQEFADASSWLDHELSPALPVLS